VDHGRQRRSRSLPAVQRELVREQELEPRGAEIDGVKGNGTQSTHARTDRATDRTSCSALLCLTVASGGRRNRYKFKR
jgi:hypothetical protein